MPLLRLQSSKHHQDEVVGVEPQLVLQVRRCLMGRIEFPQVAPIGDNNNLLLRQPLGLNQITRVGLRDRYIVVDTATGETIDKEVRFEPASSPMFSNVRCFKDYGHKCQTPDRRGEQAAVEQMGV